MNHRAYADVFRPSARGLSLLYDTLLVAGFSLLLGISAQLALPLPFSPVPVTAQTLAVLLGGALLGRVRGTAGVLLYLLEGSAGMPVFSAGRAGIGHLLGPSGGYLLGFAAAAFLVGTLAERGWDRKPLPALLAVLAGDAAIFLLGVPWLSLYTGFGKALALGLYPFLPGDLFKIAIAVTALPLGWKALGAFGGPARF